MDHSYSLLLYLVIKHFLADFPLQTKWMVNHKGRNIHALVTHVGIHVLMSSVVLLFLKIQFWKLLFLVFFEFLFHMMVDYLKVQKEFGGKYTTDERGYWFYLGLDQMFHQISYVIMTLIAINA